MKRLLLLVAAFLALTESAFAACPPCYSVPASALRNNLHCPGTFTHTKQHNPILLVHGTFARGRLNYAWSYLASFRKLGFDVCYVDLPNGAMDDIQLSSEYVVYAIRTISHNTRRKVDVLGVSQGGLEERWAVKFWPDVKGEVDDIVMHATPNHGTLMQPTTAFPHCFASCWQMTPGSHFLTALNKGDETPGSVSYTSIFTDTDELVEPQLPKSTSALSGARNVRIQDVCPGRPTDHIAISADDAVAFALDVDAFTHPGPADPRRISTLTCLKPNPDGNDPSAAGPALQDYVQHHPTYHDRTSEPPLKPYAR